jgi:UDP-N-acetyl-D-galactosamine dehydrogenase
MYQDLVDKKAKLAVIGLGYVGLPIALEFAKKISVIGFDINEKRVELMKQGLTPVMSWRKATLMDVISYLQIH